jgi:hypothetical protein
MSIRGSGRGCRMSWSRSESSRWAGFPACPCNGRPVRGICELNYRYDAHDEIPAFLRCHDVCDCGRADDRERIESGHVVEWPCAGIAKPGRNAAPSGCGRVPTRKDAGRRCTANAARTGAMSRAASQFDSDCPSRSSAFQCRTARGVRRGYGSCGSRSTDRPRLPGRRGRTG